VTELTEFRRYHVLMRQRGKLGFLPWPKISFFPVWGTRLEVGRWAVFEREALNAAYGEKWREDLDRILGKGLFLVEGEDERGKRQQLPVDEASAHTESVDPNPPGRPGGSGLNIWVYHLRTVAKIGYEEILKRAEGSDDPKWAAQLEAWGAARVSRLAGLRRMNADGRRPHAKWCADCNAQRSVNEERARRISP
jgi:hypothetical protein